MKQRKVNVRYTTELALLVAIEIVMYCTPLGMLPLPGQYASLLTVPVAVGAMALGPAAGGILGFLFGALSFWKALQTGTLLGAGVGIPSIFVLTIVTRTIMGILTGWVFRLVNKVDKTHTVSCFIGGLAAPVLNTILYMSVYVIILWNAPLLQNVLAQTLGEEIIETLKNNVILFVAAYVGVQAVIEAVVGCVASGAICKALQKTVNKGMVQSKVKA